MDRESARRKINACLAIYKDTRAPQGERDAAWERANSLAEKYGFKIVKNYLGHGPNFKRNPTRHYNPTKQGPFYTPPWFNDIMDNSQWPKEPKTDRTFTCTWEKRNNYRLYMNMLKAVLESCGHGVMYSQGSDFISVVFNGENTINFNKRFNDTMKKVYNDIANFTCGFSRDFQDYFENVGEKITNNRARKLFKVAFEQVCKFYQGKVQRESMIYNIKSSCSENEFTFIYGLMTFISIFVDDMRKEVQKLG